jgi:hypothetical protein
LQRFKPATMVLLGYCLVLFTYEVRHVERPHVTRRCTLHIDVLRTFANLFLPACRLVSGAALQDS